MKYFFIFLVCMQVTMLIGMVCLLVWNTVRKK